jgi:PKD repeat protein
MDRAPNTGSGQKWAVCLPPNAPPIAILSANPDHGPAPLSVTFTGSGTDPDSGDTIASYTFDFGDGSAPVTQASPTIMHTYGAPGEYPARLRVTDSRGLISTNTALVPIEVNAALRNISTRASVQTGENVMIAGFIVTGTDPRQILLRGLGPSVKINGQTVPGALQDPTIELHDTSQVIATNDNWKTDDATGQSQQAAIQNTGAAPGDDHESALVRTLNPGSYTVVLRGKNNTTGIGLIEAYDLDPFSNSKLANISTRGLVLTGDNVMIAGFVAGPANAAPTGIVIRGLGPSLRNSGVSSPLADPTLELHDANGTKVKTNDNWKIDDASGQSQQSDIEATGLAPTADAESAILTDVAPGTYTAVLAGKNNGSGVGLVEIYNIH